MARLRVVIWFAVLALLATAESVGRSQGLLQNQLTGLVEQTVDGVKFSTQPGFVVERVNPADKTDSYVVLTFDSQGRMVVSKENDFPRLLLDSNGDGILDAEKVVSERVRNCQGLWYDGPTLYGSCATIPPPAPTPPPAPRAAGPGGAAPGGAPAAGGRGGGRGPAPPAGIFRMEDTNSDDVTDTIETLGMAGTIQEHGPHAIRRTPEGGMMVMVGNNETVADQYLDLESHVLKYPDGQFLPYMANFGRSARMGAHSALYQWKPAQRKFHVFSGGNRNSYDFAYNLAGEAFLFDSDMEWDIGLPWYRDVRTAHQVLNGDYGYRDGSGKYPAYYIDSLPPVRDLGRGSPVGVETYQSHAYPRTFFDSLLEADWSRGRILFSALTPAGATYTARTDRAELVHGEPLNVTDMEVGPDGMLYFSTGGRNTTGGIWRLRYTGAAPPAPDRTGVLAIVRQAQPLSSWGWSAIERAKASMGASFGVELDRLARNTSANVADRSRAIYEMQRHGAAPSAELLAALMKDTSAPVRAAAVFVAGVQGQNARDLAAAGLRDADPMVRRRAAEALVRMGQSPDRPSLAPVGDIYALLADNDRFVRWAGRVLLEHTPRAEWAARVVQDTNAVSAPEGMLAWIRTRGTESVQPMIDKAMTLMRQTNLSADNKLRVMRTFMVATTELPEAGVSAAARQQLHTIVAPQFPTDDERLNREMALLLGYAGQTAGITEVLAAVPPGNTNQQLTLHYLYALRVVKSGWTTAQKEQLAAVLGRTGRWRGGAQFSNFLGQFFEQFAEIFTTDQEKQMLYARAPDFAPIAPAETPAAATPGTGRAGAAPTTPAVPGAAARGTGPGTAAAPPAAGAVAGAGAGAAAPAGVGPGRAGGGGGRGRGGTPIQQRTAGRVLDKGEIFDEVIYTPRTQQPNAAAGQLVFEGSCASCHRAGGIGNDHGVAALNLTGRGASVNRRDLLESIMFPTRAINPEHRTTVVTTAAGATVRGLVVRDTPQALTLLKSDGTTEDVPRPVRSAEREPSTIMLDAITDAMSQAQLTNLLAFLASQ